MYLRRLTQNINRLKITITTFQFATGVRRAEQHTIKLRVSKEKHHENDIHCAIIYSRQFGKALVAAEALGQREHFKGLEEGARLVQPTFDVDGQHAAVAVALPFGQLVLRVRRQPCNVNGANFKTAPSAFTISSANSIPIPTVDIT